MKVLFLDIDGVLNRRGTKERCGHFLGVDRQLARRLTDFLRGTTISIVLSSTWRLHPDMHAHLNEAGIFWDDVTPEGYSRGDEIQGWFEANPGKAAQFAILDDMYVLDCHRSRHVQTDENYGLTFEKLEELKAMFND